MSARGTLCLLAVALGGCSSMAPPLERPTLPVAATFPGQPAATQASAPVVTPEWQKFFGDERLREFITLALQNNRDLRLAVLNIEQARAQLDLRRADQWPCLLYTS